MLLLECLAIQSQWRKENFIRVMVHLCFTKVLSKNLHKDKSQTKKECVCIKRFHVFKFSLLHALY
ncbi:hypothetical protein GvMRE_IIg322 [endosymbiont GvMRE of Glomus versiforme]|nr:hypothetical protein GvMRE_IIg322 [endosymbiont GvMRE of Glomus versiforme]